MSSTVLDSITVSLDKTPVRLRQGNSLHASESLRGG
jgi:hypothetical protein